jgi:hypothetical protein
LLVRNTYDCDIPAGGVARCSQTAHRSHLSSHVTVGPWAHESNQWGCRRGGGRLQRCHQPCPIPSCNSRGRSRDPFGPEWSDQSGPTLRQGELHQRKREVRRAPPNLLGKNVLQIVCFLHDSHNRRNSLEAGHEASRPTSHGFEPHCQRFLLQKCILLF